MSTPFVRELVRDTLSAVNLLREVFGKPTLAMLPNGDPGDPKYCPIANALDGGEVRVYGSKVSVRPGGELWGALNEAFPESVGWVEWDGFFRFLLPEAFTVFDRFVEEFDNDPYSFEGELS